MKNDSLNLEIWDRLLRKVSFDGLGLSTRSGRIDLRGLKLPDSLVLHEFLAGSAKIREVDPSLTLTQFELRDLDFSGSFLEGLRLIDCTLTNCCFDYCKLQKMRMWSTEVTETSFKNANMRHGVLGGVKDGIWNKFRSVDFSDADLRNTSYSGAEFENCTFRNSKISNVNFDSSSFSSCLFEGELRDVIFFNKGSDYADFPVNTMSHVDMRHAELRYVEFRNIDLHKAILPDDEHHLIINDFYSVLKDIVDHLKHNNDRSSQKLAAYLGVFSKWANKGQKVGVINLKDIQEISGKEGCDQLCELVNSRKEQGSTAGSGLKIQD